MDKFDLRKYLAEGKLLKEEDFNYEEEHAKLDTPERAAMIARKLADLEDENEEEAIGNENPYSDEIRRDEANNLADDIELEGDEKQTFIADLMKATEDTTSPPSGSPWDTFYDTANSIMKKYLAEGKLLKENELSSVSKPIKDAINKESAKKKTEKNYKDWKSTNETVDKDDLKNAKFRLKKVLKYLDIEYKKTRRGEKYVQINYIPITRPQSQNPEFVNVRYEDETDLQNIGKALNESKVLTGEEVAKALRKLDQKYDDVVSKDFIIKVKRLKKVTKKTLEKMGAKGKILDDIFGLLKEDREAEEMAAGMPPKPGSKRDKDAEMRSETFSITSEYEGKMERLSYDQIKSTLESALEIANNVEDFVEKVTYGLTDETSVLSLEDQDKLEIWYNSKVPKTQDFDGEVGDDLRSDLSDIDKLKDEYKLLYSEKYPSGARRAGFKHRSTLGNDRYGDFYFHSDWPREFRHEDEYDSMSDDKQDILSQVEEFEFEVDKLFDKYGVPQNSHAG